MARADVSEFESLLWWEIDHDIAVGARSPGVNDRLLLAIRNEGVVVAHKDDGCFQALCTRLSNVFETVLIVDVVLDGDGVGPLNYGSVGDGIGEGHTELDDICTTGLEGE